MNILLSSAGRRSYLVEYFKSAVGGAGCVIAANSGDCPAFYAADESVITPLIYDENYIPFLLDYCEKHDIDLLIPLFDIDIPVLAQHKDQFAALGTCVVVPDYEIAQICNDKWQTVQYLAKHDIQVPTTALGLEQALEMLANGSLQYPVVVKPRWGMASIGTHIATNESELRVLYGIVEREIADSYLKYESAVCIESSIIIQNMLPGQEHGLDVMCDLDGTYQATSAKQKVAMRSGETDSAVVVDSSLLQELGKKLAQVCPHPGNLDVDVFVEGEQAWVLELNARFGGGYPFSHAAGVDLPSALVRWREGEEVDPQMLFAQPGVKSYKELLVKLVPTR
ncbi:ATP-grasp domain-containing protein [Adlercreutzia agrestimuris]|uniref:ATP-grasp domain-containing protein n=1 Tax=Adlercreutzia agrestimuris TaxID=2941324 RepID=UPI00203C3C2B|nr:ATP-grasp domain-containing protein [Adlercreutzia agrestimuris]